MTVPKLALVGVTETVSVAVCAVPTSGTTWGLPVSESVNCMVACRTPAAVGVKFTETPQVFPCVTVVQPLLVIAKSPALVPCR